jgi:hypothetical protein
VKARNLARHDTKETNMTQSKTANDCRCAQASCGCASRAQAETRCTCGASCTCERTCRCGEGCGCASKK